MDPDLDPGHKSENLFILVQIFFHSQKNVKHFFIPIFYYFALNDNDFFSFYCIKKNKIYFILALSRRRAFRISAFRQLLRPDLNIFSPENSLSTETCVEGIVQRSLAASFSTSGYWEIGSESFFNFSFDSLRVSSPFKTLVLMNCI